MAKLAIKSETAKQKRLFPIDIEELIPKTHIVRVVDTIIDRLDISEIIGTYKGGGNSAFSPRTMLKVLVYAYLCNIYSSRKIEQSLRETFMWLSGLCCPNWRTINYFRDKRLKSNFDNLFTQVVLLLSEEGFVSLKVQYVDGTKVESCANKYTFVWKKTTEKTCIYYRCHWIAIKTSRTSSSRIIMQKPSISWVNARFLPLHQLCMQNHSRLDVYSLNNFHNNL